MIILRLEWLPLQIAFKVEKKNRRGNISVKLKPSEINNKNRNAVQGLGATTKHERYLRGGGGGGGNLQSSREETL